MAKQKMLQIPGFNPLQSQHETLGVSFLSIFSFPSPFFHPPFLLHFGIAGARLLLFLALGPSVA